MPADGVHIKFSDINRRDQYPRFIIHEGYFYETFTSSPTAVATNTTLLCALSTTIKSVSAFNTLPGMIIAAANEDARIVQQPTTIYAYYDI